MSVKDGMRIKGGVAYKPVHCSECGQEITEAAALKKAKERQAALDKEKEIDSAGQAANKSIEKAIKAFNAKKGLIQKLDVSDWCTGESVKEPIEYMQFDFFIAGQKCGSQEIEGFEEVLEFLRKLGVDVNAVVPKKPAPRKKKEWPKIPREQ